MILTCEQMKAAEDALFATGVEAEPLMEKAGWGCVEAIRQFFPRPGQAILFVGPGHNGGDALVVGRHLREAGWLVEARVATATEKLADLTRKKLAEFEATPNSSSNRATRGARIQVDGLLGIGARGALRGDVAPLAGTMNANRATGLSTTFAVDIPSGVDGNTGEPYGGAVLADFTLAIGEVKAGLLADAGINHVGRLVRIPLPEIVPLQGDSSQFSLQATELAARLPPLPFSTHKGQAGRIAIYAGSPGYAGAAVLCGLGALRAGGGLVSLLCDPEIQGLIAAKAAPEIMVRDVHSDVTPDAIAIGPGLGPDPPSGLIDRIREDSCPMVVDADALNALAQNPDGGFTMPSNRLVTPHPGEFRRLAPDMEGSRSELARAFVERHSVTLLLKGARTIIAAPERPLAFNSTGNPGMATGGIGDVLTGVCVALAARGLELYDAACVGSWLIGRAAEILVWEDGLAPEGISAGAIAEKLPFAIQGLRREDF